jgi:uridine phosphorylase
VSFIPYHMNAIAEDFEGNQGKGRYLILPGSDGRAKQIATRLTSLKVKEHPRSHNLYLGQWKSPEGNLDIGVISTGMGAPSIDIILHELYGLGAKNFIRVGTAGSLQPSTIKAGHIVVATGAVRDESTTSRFVPVEFPALPSLSFLLAAERASKTQDLVSFGLCHSKDSLYAREFGSGPQKAENHAYMSLLKASGVLASEMEASALYILCSMFDHLEKSQKKLSLFYGAILAVIGDDQPFASKDIEKTTTEKAIDLAFAVYEDLHRSQK